MSDEPIKLPIEDSIDLHTFQPHEVADLVGDYLDEATARGFREVRIIHGRGIGAQREIVQSVLRRRADVAAFWDAPDRGSTHVRLKAPRS